MLYSIYIQSTIVFDEWSNSIRLSLDSFNLQVFIISMFIGRICGLWSLYTPILLSCFFIYNIPDDITIFHYLRNVILRHYFNSHCYLQILIQLISLSSNSISHLLRWDSIFLQSKFYHYLEISFSLTSIILSKAYVLADYTTAFEQLIWFFYTLVSNNQRLYYIIVRLDLGAYWIEATYFLLKKPR